MTEFCKNPEHDGFHRRVHDLIRLFGESWAGAPTREIPGEWDAAVERFVESTVLSQMREPCCSDHTLPHNMQVVGEAMFLAGMMAYANRVNVIPPLDFPSDGIAPLTDEEWEKVKQANANRDTEALAEVLMPRLVGNERGESGPEVPGDYM